MTKQILALFLSAGAIFTTACTVNTNRDDGTSGALGAVNGTPELDGTGAFACSKGSCKETCAAGVASCEGECSGGHCEQTCPAGSTCTFHCSGGGCQQYCEGAHCTLTCSGGGCLQDCAGGTCDKTCSGKGCS